MRSTTVIFDSSLAIIRSRGRLEEGRRIAVVTELGGLAQNPEPAGEAEVIDVRGLRMRYGSVDVLGGVDFTAARGEVLALLGPNGAGKTTTIEILEGFRMRSAGEVSVLGVDPAAAGERPVTWTN